VPNVFFNSKLDFVKFNYNFFLLVAPNDVHLAVKIYHMCTIFKKKKDLANSDSHYIIDEPINLHQTDYLHTERYATALIHTIEHAPAQKPFTIGLYGGWGTGKSSIVETAKEHFSKSKTALVYVYDAWQYQNDSFRRTFLLALCENLGQKNKTQELKVPFYATQTQSVASPYVQNICLWGGVLFVFLAVLGEYIPLIRNLFPPETSFLISITLFFSNLFSLIIPLVEKLKAGVSTQVSQSPFFAPEQFAQEFESVVADAPANKKLVIVIDNLDRCQPENVYTMLSDIKTFMGKAKHSIVFVVPIDDEALIHQLFDKNDNTNTHQQKEEFLRKLFNTVIRIRPYKEMDMRAFAQQLSENNHLHFKPDTLYLASREYSKNPRRIIQLFNNLLSEEELYSHLQDFNIKEHEALLCAHLIMKEEYPTLCKYVAEHPQFIKEDRKTIINHLNNISPKEEGQKDNNIEAYLIYTEPIFKKASLRDIEIVFTNVLTHIDLPIEIIEAVHQYNVNVLLQQDDLSLYHDSVSRLIENELQDAVKFESNVEVSNIFKMICLLYSKIDLSSSLRGFNGALTKYGYAKIIEELDISQEICSFAKYMSQHGFPAEQNAILTICSDLTDKKKGSTNTELLKYAILTFVDEESLLKLSSPYDIFAKQLNIADELNADHYKYLVSDNHLTQMTNNIASLTQEDSSLSFICKASPYHENLSENFWKTFLSKCNTLMHSIKLKPYKVAMTAVSTLNEFFATRQQNGELNSVQQDIKNLYNKILPNVITAKERAYLQKVTENESYRMALICLSFQLYKLTNGSILLKNLFSIMKDYKHILMQCSTKMIDENVPIKNIQSDVLGCLNDFTDQASINLLEKISFLKDSLGNYIVPQKSATQKFSLLVEASTKQDIAIPLIIKFCDDPLYSTDMISTIRKRNINPLPQELQRYCS